MTITSIEVSTPSASYTIHIEPGLLRRLPDHLGTLSTGSRIGLVTTQPIFDLYGETVRSAIEEAGRDVTLAIIPDGEEFKTLETVATLYDTLIEAGFDRHSTLVSLGGGVVGDITGFVAATYLRGIDFIQIPTTLLAMVDASVGGKTGVNHPRGKNLIGAFHQPGMVLIDPTVLKTLDRRMVVAGAGEIIKTGAIASPPMLATLADRLEDLLSLGDESLLVEIIAEACRIKAEIVGADERESDLRRVLNFGHTFGHALETTLGHGQIQHGEAVSYGMVAAARLSRAVLNFPDADYEALVGIIRRLGLPPLPALDRPAIMEQLNRDKKAVDGKVHFVLLERLGKPVVTAEAPEAAIEVAIKDMEGFMT